MNKNFPSAGPNHVCGTCGLAGGFDYPPTPGGPKDGVNCRSQRIAEINGCSEEYSLKGSALLWRIESIAEDAACAEWQLKPT